jgi:hypothetical protein
MGWDEIAGVVSLEGSITFKSLNSASRASAPLCVHPRHLSFTLPVFGRQQHHRKVDAKASCPRVRRDSVSQGASDLRSFLIHFKF